MTDPAPGPGPATSAPRDGWADQPRPPRSVVLTAAQSRRLQDVGLRATQVRPLVTRSVVAVLLGALLAWSQTLAVGVAVGLGFLLLAGVLALHAVRRVRAIDLTGRTRATGYDRHGSFVLAGDLVTVMRPGWARAVEHHDGVTVLRPHSRLAAPYVVVAALVTTEDEAFLRGSGRG